MTSPARTLSGLTTVALYVLASILAGLSHGPVERSTLILGGKAGLIAAALCAHEPGSGDGSGAPILPAGSCDACVLMAAASLPPAAPAAPLRALRWIVAEPHFEARAPHRPAVARPTSRGPPAFLA